MKIVLTGGLGFVGKYVIRELAKSTSLTVLSTAESAPKNTDFIKGYGVRLEIGDIRDSVRVAEIMLEHRPDFIRYIKGSAPAPVSTSDSLRAVQTMDYARMSISQDKAVIVPPLEDQI